MANRNNTTIEELRQQILDISAELERVAMDYEEMLVTCGNDNRATLDARCLRESLEVQLHQLQQKYNQQRRVGA